MLKREKSLTKITHKLLHKTEKYVRFYEYNIVTCISITLQNIVSLPKSIRRQSTERRMVDKGHSEGGAEQLKMVAIPLAARLYGN